MFLIALMRMRPVADDRIGIRPAGMIDVARDVRARRAVDGPARVHLEQIAIIRNVLALLVREQRAGVVDDEGALPDRSVANTPSPVRERPTRNAWAPLSSCLALPLVLLDLRAAMRLEMRWMRFSVSLTRHAARGQPALVNALHRSTVSRARSEKASPARDAGWEPVFGPDHAQPNTHQ
jgi:hypothetical protein